MIFFSIDNLASQAIFSLAHIEGITLGPGEEVDEVAGGAIINI